MKRLFFILLLFAGIETFAQQEPQFTQFMFVSQTFNPGYVGAHDSLINTTAMYRNQWVGFPGNPVTFLYTADSPIKKLHGGAGLKFMDDKLGNFHFDRLGLSYAWHKQIKKTGLLVIGMEADVVYTTVAFNWLAPDGTNGASDPAIPDKAVSGFSGNLAIGAYFRNDHCSVGLSSTQLLTVSYLRSEQFNYRPARHYYLTAGYNIYFGSRGKLVPSVLVKSDAAISTFDLNLTSYWNKWLWTGVSYRLQDAVAFMAGFQIKTGKAASIKLGYAYDLGTSDLKMFHDNTHEVFLNYRMSLKRGGGG